MTLHRKFPATRQQQFLIYIMYIDRIQSEIEVFRISIVQVPQELTKNNLIISIITTTQ